MPDVEASVHGAPEGDKVLDGGAGDDIVAHPGPAADCRHRARVRGHLVDRGWRRWRTGPEEGDGGVTLSGTSGVEGVVGSGASVPLHAWQESRQHLRVEKLSFFISLSCISFSATEDLL